MLTTYKWIIGDYLPTAPSEDGLTDVVKSVNWIREASAVVYDKVYSVTSYGVYWCGAPNPDDFTAYDTLTQADVEKWLNDGLDVLAIDKALDIKLDQLISPPIVNLPVPWNNPL